MDHQILTSVLPKELKKVIKNNLSNYPELYPAVSFRMITQDIIEEDNQKQLLDNKTRTLLVRCAARFSYITGTKEWIDQLHDTDTVIQAMQLFQTPANQAKESLEKLEQLMRSFSTEDDVEGTLAYYQLLFTKQAFLGNLGDLERLENLINECTAIYEEHKDNKIIAFYQGLSFISGGWFFLLSGDFEKAQIYLRKAFEHGKKLKSQAILGYAYNNIGVYHMQRGNLEQAIECITTARTIREDLQELRGVLVADNNLSSAYLATGNYEQAIDVLHKSINDYKRWTEEGKSLFFEFQVLLVNLSNSYKLKGEFDQAHTYALEAYEYMKQASQTSYYTAIVTHQLIDVLLEAGQYAEIHLYMKEFEQTLQKIPFYSLQLRYHYDKARLELHRQNFGQAQDSLNEALDYGLKTQEFTELINIQLKFVELFIQKYRISDDNENLKQAQKYLDIVVQATKEQEFHTLLIEALMLSANIFSLEGQKEQALTVLKEAEPYTKEFSQYKEKINELKKLIKKHSKSKNVEEKAEQKRSIVSRLWTQIKESFNFMFVKKPLYEEVKLIGVLVMDQGGLPFYSRFLEDNFSQDNILVSGLISAINAFAANVFGEAKTGLLKSINHENMTILLENRSDILVALVADKESFILRNQLVRFTYSIPPVNVGNPNIQNPEFRHAIDEAFTALFAQKEDF